MRQNHKFGYLENVFTQVTPQGRLKISDTQTQVNNLSRMREVNNRRGIKTKGDKIEYLLQHGVGGFHLFDVAIKNKSLLKRIDLEFRETDTELVIEFDVFTLLGITKRHVPSQLQEINNFWTEVKFLMMPYLDAYPMLRIFNSRDHHNKTYFELNLCTCKDDSAEEYSPEQVKYIQDLAAESVTLTEMFTRAALNLNKVGPHSTAMVRYSDVLNNDELRAQFTKETKERYKGLNQEMVQVLIDHETKR